MIMKREFKQFQANMEKPLEMAFHSYDAATWRYLLPLAFVESRGVYEATNPSGAIGLCQLKPATATVAIFRGQSLLDNPAFSYVKRIYGSVIYMTSLMKYDNHKLPSNNDTGITVSRRDLLDPALNLFCAYSLALYGFSKLQPMCLNEIDKFAVMAAMHHHGTGLARKLNDEFIGVVSWQDLMKSRVLRPDDKTYVKNFLDTYVQFDKKHEIFDLCNIDRSGSTQGSSDYLAYRGEGSQLYGV